MIFLSEELAKCFGDLLCAFLLMGVGGDVSARKHFQTFE